MALQLSYDTEYGINLNNSYARIEEQSGGKENLYLRLRYYASKEAANAGKRWIEERIFEFVPSVEDSAPNFLKQGYEYLKGLPEFAIAIDVLE